MDLRSCCGSGSRSSSDTIHLGGHQQSHNSSLSSSTAMIPSGRFRKPVKWRGIWTWLLKEKCRNVDQFQVPSYDSYTYSQNFDQGVAWDVPENISRSFSARFADSALSSRVYRKKKKKKCGKTMNSIIEVG